MATLIDLLVAPATWGTIAAVFILYQAIASIMDYRKLRHIDGPLLASFSELWIFWKESTTQHAEAQFAALQEYGTPCRIGPRMLLTDDADLVRHMSAPASKWRRSYWYTGTRFDPRLDTVFSTRDESVHADLKSRVAGGYHGRDIPDRERDIDDQVLALEKLIRQAYQNKSVDFGRLAQFFTLDVLSTVAFGRPFGFIEANEDMWDFIKTSNDVVKIILLGTNHELIGSILRSPIVQAIVAPQPTDKTGVGAAVGFAHAAVAERFGPQAQIKRDMLGSFVAKGLNQTQCEAEAFLQIIAGSDSTTSTLRCTIYLLAGTPPAYEKLRREIDDAWDKGRLSTPVPTYNETLKLPYLRACILEAMRLFPPLFGLTAKIAPPGGETFKGVYYPEGTSVATCYEALGKRQEVFGEDVAHYRPDRYLEGDEQLRAKRIRQTELLFGSGRFVCLGKVIAQMELNKVIATLWRNFDFAIADPMKGVPNKRCGVNMQDEMNLILRPRENQGDAKDTALAWKGKEV